MATATANPRVQRLRDEAHAKAEESARFFEGLTEAQAGMVTEIGWTIAATAAHLASSAGLSAIQLTRCAGISA